MYTARLTSGLITRSRRVLARSRTLGLPWYEAGDGVVIVVCVIVSWVGGVVVAYEELGARVARCSGLLGNDGGLMFKGGLEL